MAEPFRPDVVDEDFQLDDRADLVAGGAVDGNDCLGADLEIFRFRKGCRD